MSENTIEIVAEPAFYTKGSPEYHAERERALVKRLEDARKREAEVKAKHAEELRPVHAQMESLGAEVTTRDQEIANARKGVSDTREDIAGKQRLIESLKSEIAVMESAIQRVEENIIPDLERSKADLQKLVSTATPLALRSTRGGDAVCTRPRVMSSISACA